MNWLERARHEIRDSTWEVTAVNDERTITAVLAVQALYKTDKVLPWADALGAHLQALAKNELFAPRLSSQLPNYLPYACLSPSSRSTTFFAARHLEISPPSISGMARCQCVST